MYMKFGNEQPYNEEHNRNESLPPIDEGKEVPPALGTVAYSYQRIQELQENLATAKTDEERKVFKRQIESFTQQMNDLSERAMKNRKINDNNSVNVVEIDEHNIAKNITDTGKDRKAA